VNPVVKLTNDNDKYNFRLQQLRQRARKVATQEQLNAYLLLVVDENDRKGIFELMWPYLPFSDVTCPEGPAHDVVGN